MPFNMIGGEIHVRVRVSFTDIYKHARQDDIRQLRSGAEDRAIPWSFRHRAKSRPSNTLFWRQKHFARYRDRSECSGSRASWRERDHRYAAIANAHALLPVALAVTLPVDVVDAPAQQASPLV